MRVASLEVPNACITKFTVKHNGYQGGDAGHGGFVEIDIEDLSSTAMEVSYLDINNQEIPLIECQNIKLKFSGDAERDNLIEGLKFLLSELKNHKDL